jgi:hypothetical protein
MSTDTRLLIPATPELLEGWCGPVVVTWLQGWTETAACFEGRIFICEGDWPVEDMPDYGAVHLDLSRAEVRDRVARVVGPGVGAMVLATGMLSGAHRHRVIASRAPHLDPTDDTRLPDGSRLVDALALAAVAREVTGE